MYNFLIAYIRRFFFRVLASSCLLYEIAGVGDRPRCYCLWNFYISIEREAEDISGRPSWITGK